MRCPNCGNENPPDYVFCDECGARLQEGEGTDSALASGVATTEESAAPEETSTAGAQGSDQKKVIQPLSSMVVTPRQDDIAAGSSDGDDVTSTQMSGSDTSFSGNDAQGAGDSGGEGDSNIPVTDDTVSASPSDIGGMSGDGSGLSAEPMPDVVEIGSSEGSMPAAGDEAASEVSTTNAPDISPAASGTPAVAGDGASTAWASTALAHLDEAQQAMSKGDYVGYGQSLGNLRSLLEGIVAGTAAGGPDTQTGENAGSVSSAPTPISYAQTQGSSSNAASSADSLGSIPMVEPAAEAGTLTAAPEPEPAQADTSRAATAEAMPVSGEPPAVARLVVISTGAELSLPDQEEISVGREDPSSGIFPDVDLTPYGGEEGGVSRRHARLLHIGDDYFVEDLQATNFTKLDGQRLPAHAREKIEDGARLDFGRVAVIFRRS